jgi:hypothetical protein
LGYHREGRIVAHVAAFTLPAIFYIVRRQADLQRAHDSVRICLETLAVVSVQRSTLELARTFPGNDFEDNLQMACTREGDLDVIVTRYPSDFAGAPVPVLTPTELLARQAPEDK